MIKAVLSGAERTVQRRVQRMKGAGDEDGMEQGGSINTIRNKEKEGWRLCSQEYKPGHFQLGRNFSNPACAK